MWRVRVLAAISLVASLLVVPAFPAKAVVSTGVGIVTNGLVLYYDPANPDAYNGAKLRDLSGNGYDATFYKTGSWPGQETAWGKYLGFDGAGGYLDIDSNLSSITWPGLTVTFYANFGGGAGNFERIIDFGNGAQVDNIIVGRRGTEANIFAEVFQGSASSGHCMGAANSIGVGTWDYWSITFNGTTCTIYKNNSYSGSLSYPRLPNTAVRNNAYVGKSNWADAAFEGGISDLAVYNRVLNSSELTQNYNAGIDITAPSLTTNYVNMAENQTSTGYIAVSESSYFVNQPGGDDTKFSISSNGILTFSEAPSYESPRDSDQNNTYWRYVRLIDYNGNYTDTWYQVTVTNVVEPTYLTAPALSATPYKGVKVTITVTPSGDTSSIPGKITFLIAGKRIPGCYKMSYSGTGNASCLFDPSIQGFREISVTYTPTNTSFTPSSSKKTFWIYKRATTR